MVGIFSGRHGNPEDAFASACRTLEEMAPAVVWFDEIEMGISSRTNDAAGTLGRLFAFFLTWMQEKRAASSCGDGQPHRPAAGGDDPQGTFRRGVLRRLAVRGRSRRDLQDSSQEARREP